MADPQRILMIRPSALGDVCRTVPVLVSLRRAFAEAQIDWVVRDSYIDAVAEHPGLSNAIAFPRSRLASWWRNPRTAAATWSWFGALGRAGYDLVIDCQGLVRSALMAAATAAPMRIGSARAREFAWLAYNQRVPCPAALHTVDAMLQLLDPLGIEIVRDMRLYTSDSNRQWWQQTADEHALRAGSKYAVLAPTSRWPSKRWPIERWRELLGPLGDLGIDRCIVVGAPGEQQQVGALVDAESSLVNLVGRATIGQTMAVIEGASLVIANDSAPLHMAVGFDVPCVALFGPTDPDLVGPYQREESVVRPADASNAAGAHFKDKSLGDSLMRQISVDDVINRAQAVLGCSASPQESMRSS